MLRDDAYGRLKQCLFESAIKPGQLVSQKELAALIGCPVGPTREAIHRLAAESVLRVVPQRGIVINDLNLEFIRNVFQLRAMIEREAVQVFFSSATPREVRSLRQAHERILRRAARRIDRALLAEALRVDWKFHDRIVAALDNALVEEIYRVNSDRMRLIQAKRGFVPERLVSAMREHLGILEVGMRKGPAAAAAAMDRHLLVSTRWALRV